MTKPRTTFYVYFPSDLTEGVIEEIEIVPEEPPMIREEDFAFWENIICIEA